MQSGKAQTHAQTAAGQGAQIWVTCGMERMSALARWFVAASHMVANSLLTQHGMYYGMHAMLAYLSHPAAAAAAAVCVPV
jgi:hypothetical protein